MYLFYVRHGNPCYDPDSLTAHGKREAEAVGRRLARFGIDEIYASDSVRAYETSIPLSEITHKEVTKLPWANEKNTANYFYLYSERLKMKRWVFENADFKDLFTSKEIEDLGKEWYKHPALKQYNMEEGVKMLDKNIDEFLLSLGYRHDREHKRFIPVNPTDKKVALFAHQGMGIYFLSSIFDIPYPEFCVRFDMVTSGLTAIIFENENGYVYPKTVQFSSDAHLYAENLPTGYNNFINTETKRFNY
ncbi:MAG: histidine phosphatase family protein [Clostridia bacterium]|nr:histidine phosphatase family protein [Clostridia bacterium]